MKNIVVYHSQDGNTRKVAELLAQRLQAPLVALELVKPYPRFGLFRFAACALAAIGGKPQAIKDTGTNWADYERVIVGTPTWMGHPAPAVRDFLAKESMAGKQVALFTTCSHMAQDCIAETELLLKGGMVVGRQVFTGHDLAGRHADPKAMVDNWVKRFSFGRD